MAGPIYKLLIFLKRRNGMSLDAFRDHYENVHASLSLKYSAGGLRRYVRRYVEAFPQPPTRESGELPFDVVTELWFDDRAAFENAAKFASRGDLPAEILADEERLFDRSKSRYATVVECETDLSSLGGARRVT
jgi:uncharacterized protein (TIGR02118 family)